MNRREFLKGMAVGTAAATCCGGCQAVEYFWDNFCAETKTMNDMFIKQFMTTSIMSWNINGAIDADGKYNLDRVVDEIKSVDADVVLLQDVDRKTRRARGADQVELIEAATKLKAKFLRSGIRAGGETGLAIMAPEEPLKTQELDLPGDGKLLIAEYPEFWAANVHFGEYAEDRMVSLKILREMIATSFPVFLGGNWRDGDYSSEFMHEMRNSFSILVSAESLYGERREVDEADYIAVSRRHRQRFEHVTRIPCEELTASTHRPLAVKVR